MKIKEFFIVSIFIISLFIPIIIPPTVAAQSPCTAPRSSVFYGFPTSNISPWVQTGNGTFYWYNSYGGDPINGRLRFDYWGGTGSKTAMIELDNVSLSSDLGIPSNMYIQELVISYKLRVFQNTRVTGSYVKVLLLDGTSYLVHGGVGTNVMNMKLLGYSNPSPISTISVMQGWYGRYNTNSDLDDVRISWTCTPPNTPAPTVSIPTRTPTSPPTPTPTLTSTPAGTCLIGTTDYRTAAVDNQSIEMGTGAGVLPVFQSNLNSIVNGNYRILFDVIPQSTLLLPAGITVEYYDENPQQWVLLGDYFINNRTGSVNGSLGWGILLPVNRPISAIRFKSLNYPGDNSPVVIDRIYVEGVDCTIQLPTPYAGTPVRSPNTPTATATPVPPNPPTPTQTACSSGGPCSYWTPIPPPLNPTITSTPCVINGGCPIIPKPSSTTTPRTNPFPTNIPTPLRTTIPNPSTSTPPNNPNPNPNPSTSTPPNNPNPKPKTSTSTPPPNNPPAGFGGTPSWSAPSAVVAPAPVKWIYAATPDFRKVYTIEQPILISATVPLTISGSGIVTTTLYMSGTLITLNGFMGTVADYNSYIRTEISGTLGTVTIVRQVAPANYAPSLPRSLANIGYTFENMDTSKKYSLLSWSQFFGEIIAALFNFIRTLYQLATHLGPLGLMLKWLFAMLVLNGAIWTFYFLFRVLLTLIKLVVRLIEIIGGYAPTGG